MTMDAAIRSTDLWCFNYPDTHSWPGLRHFHPSKMQVGMCGTLGGPSDPPIVRVQVAEIQPDEGSTYHAWWSNADQRFSMVFSHKQAVEICFPYGSKVEEDRGRGHLLNVSVTMIEPELEKAKD